LGGVTLTIIDYIIFSHSIIGMKRINKTAVKSDSSSVGKTPQSWIKRIGVWGFLFFLVKGLLWLTVPTLIYWINK